MTHLTLNIIDQLRAKNVPSSARKRLPPAPMQIGKRLKMTTILFLKKFLKIKLLCIRESKLFYSRLPAPTFFW